MQHHLVGILFLSVLPVFAQSGVQPGWRELVQDGEQLYVQQRYDEAGDKYREAMKTAEVTASEEVLARVRCDLGLVEVSRQHYVEAEPMLKGCPASTPIERLAAWTNLGTLYSLMNRYAEAERLFRQAYELARRDGFPTKTRALLVDNMANHSLRKGDYREAESLLREAQGLYVKSGLPWDSANSTGNLGVALVKEGRLQEARDELESAIRQTETLGGPSHPMLAGLLGGLAAVDDREGRYADAEPRLKRAVAIAGLDCPYLPELLSTYAWTLRHLHRAGEARRLERRARAMATTRRPPEIVSFSELLRESGKR